MESDLQMFKKLQTNISKSLYYSYRNTNNKDFCYMLFSLVDKSGFTTYLPDNFFHLIHFLSTAANQ